MIPGSDPNAWDGTFAHDIDAKIGHSAWGESTNKYRVVFYASPDGSVWSVQAVHRLVYPSTFEGCFWRTLPIKGPTARKAIGIATRSRWVADPYTGVNT